MDNRLSDVTVHVDEALDDAGRRSVEGALQALEGVESVRNPDETPHLLVVRFDPGRVGTAAILSAVTGHGVHAELVGL